MRRVLVSLLAIACSSDPTPAGNPRSFVDQGRVCLYPEGTDPGTASVPSTDLVTYVADGALLVTVQAPECLSSSCSKDRKAECTVTLRGSVLDVRSQLSFRNEGSTCTTDCGALVARCKSPPLPVGTYRIQHGTSALTLNIPSSRRPSCAGKALPGFPRVTMEEVREQFDDFVEGANRCTVVTECARVSPGCPLGCSVAVRADRQADVEAKARELIEEYKGGGPGCFYFCAPERPLGCIDGRCAFESPK